MRRSCLICRGPLTRREDESADKWARRRFCSLQCARAHQRDTKKKPPIVCTDCGVALMGRRRRTRCRPCHLRWWSKISRTAMRCARCDKRLNRTRSRAIRDARRARALYCGSACKNAARRLPFNDKVCPNCSQVFSRRPTDSGRTWKARGYCSRACGNSAKRRRLDLLGVKLNAAELARVVGMSESYVGRRLKDGQGVVGRLGIT